MQPKEKHLEMAQELGLQVQALLAQTLPLSSSDLDEVEALAKKLIFPASTSFYGYEVLGVVSSLRGDLDKTLMYFKKAFQKAPNETVLKAMFAKSLMFLGDVGRSVEALDFYTTHKTGDILALRTALNLFIFFGQSTKAENMMNQLEKLRVDDLTNDPSIIEAWKNTGIPEDILLEYVGLVYRFAAENGVDTRHPFLEVDVEDGSTLYYVLQDAGHSDKELHILDRKLGEYLAPFIMAHRDLPLLNVLFTVERFQ